MRDESPEFIEEIRKLPPQIRIRRKIKKENGNGIIVYAKKGDESIFRFLNKKKEYLKLSNESFFKIFESNQTEKPFMVSDNFEKYYSEISKNLFNKKFLTALDRGKKRTLDKLNAILEKAPKNIILIFRILFMF